YYPVLIGENPVTNKCKFDKNMVVTGVNASGKTTFLKSTTINIIFTQQVGCGFYKSCKLNPYTHIHSYLNIPDTSGRDSLFQAESRRCKEIIDIIYKYQDPTKYRHFCIFDELYSGTNPHDATKSAYAFLLYLSKYNNVNFILTTHYVGLCKKLKKSAVEFILGDAMDPMTVDRIGVTDIVFCAGVLYHHPSPFDLLVSLRRVCGKTLILRTSTIPEIGGLPNAAVYFPKLNSKARKLWNLRKLGLLKQVGITDAFDPNEGYGNWFWGLTPSCLASLLETAGFEVERRFNEPFAQTFICKAVDIPFAHRLPAEREAMALGSAISSAGIALPA
ncbi:MAG: hypothetical protein EBR87_11420, partial [Cytophagia bacterium]|nr:hypothetical protein [Cytophagia bacterium]